MPKLQVNLLMYQGKFVQNTVFSSHGGSPPTSDQLKHLSRGQFAMRIIEMHNNKERCVEVMWRRDSTLSIREIKRKKDYDTRITLVKGTYDQSYDKLLGELKHQIANEVHRAVKSGEISYTHNDLNSFTALMKILEELGLMKQVHHTLVVEKPDRYKSGRKHLVSTVKSYVIQKVQEQNDKKIKHDHRSSQNEEESKQAYHQDYQHSHYNMNDNNNVDWNRNNNQGDNGNKPFQPEQDPEFLKLMRILGVGESQPDNSLLEHTNEKHTQEKVREDEGHWSEIDLEEEGEEHQGSHHSYGRLSG